jgi:hypothetical protein
MGVLPDHSVIGAHSDAHPPTHLTYEDVGGKGSGIYDFSTGISVHDWCRDQLEWILQRLLASTSSFKSSLFVLNIGFRVLRKYSARSFIKSLFRPRRQNLK